MTLTGTGLPCTRLEKSSLAHDSRYAPKAGTVELSSECWTTWSIKVGDRRLPVVMVMIAARLSRAVAAPENSAQPSSSNGTPVAGTGLSATSRVTRPGACSTACWTALPDIECPTMAKRSQPSSSARARASAAASAIVNSPATSRRPP